MGCHIREGQAVGHGSLYRVNGSRAFRMSYRMLSHPLTPAPPATGAEFAVAVVALATLRRRRPRPRWDRAAARAAAGPGWAAVAARPAGRRRAAGSPRP